MSRQSIITFRIRSPEVDETGRHDGLVNEQHTWGRRLSGTVSRTRRRVCSVKTRNKGVVRDFCPGISRSHMVGRRLAHGLHLCFASLTPHMDILYSAQQLLQVKCYSCMLNKNQTGLLWVIALNVVWLMLVIKCFFTNWLFYCLSWSWDDAYKRELQTYKDIGDVGEIW